MERKKNNTAETNEGGNCFISAEVAQMGADDARRVFLESSAVCYSFILVRFLPFFTVFTSLLHLVLKIEACK